MVLDRKQYMLEYQRKWMANRRHQFFIDKSCVKCGSTDDLELDHIDPETKHPRLRQSGSSIWSWSQERRDAEILKCQVLCNVCHLKKTQLWYNDRRVHGTRTMYSWGCRCRPCMDAEVNGVNSARRLRRQKIKNISDSSNGRTSDSGSENQCSNH